MAAVFNGYTKIINDNKILYVPTCLIVEMFTHLYSQISYIESQGNRIDVKEELVTLLKSMSKNLRTTTNAYRQGGILAFVGDWDEDNKRAKTLFFNVISRLGNLSSSLKKEDENEVREVVKELTQAWSDLGSIMKLSAKRMSDCGGQPKNKSHYRNADAWHRNLAEFILVLDTKADYTDPNTYLILLCYNRVKDVLVDAMKDVLKDSGTGQKVPHDKILCMSSQDVCIDCAKCSQMVESFRRDATTIIHNSYINLRQKGRHTMPESLLEA